MQGWQLTRAPPPPPWEKERKNYLHIILATPGRQTRCGSVTEELESQVGYLGPLPKVVCIRHKI